MAEEITLKAKIIFEEGNIGAGGTVRTPSVKMPQKKEQSAFKEGLDFFYKQIKKLFSPVIHIYTEYIAPVMKILYAVFGAVMGAGGLALAVGGAVVAAIAGAPEILVGLAAAAAVAFATWLNNNFDITGWFEDKFASVSEWFSNLISNFKWPWEGIDLGQIFSDWLSAQLDIGEAILNWFKEKWTDVTDWFSNLFKEFKWPWEGITFKWPWDGIAFKWPWEGVNMAALLREWLFGNSPKQSSAQSSSGSSGATGSWSSGDALGWKGKDIMKGRTSNKGNAGWW